MIFFEMMEEKLRLTKFENEKMERTNLAKKSKLGKFERKIETRKKLK